MQAAMCEDYEKAEEILNEILDEDQSHLEIYKRKIAVLQVNKISSVKKLDFLS